MGKPKHNRGNRSLPKKESPPLPSTDGTEANVGKRKRSIPRILFSMVRNTLAALGLFFSIWIPLWPRVYVYPSGSLDPNNPMFTLFVVRNEGYFTIRDVKFSFPIKYLKAPGGPTIIAEKPYENSFTDPKQVSQVIRPGEEASELLPFSGMEHNQFENADIAVRLNYRPFRWFSYEREELHRFEVKRKDKYWHWVPQPINK